MHEVGEKPDEADNLSAVLDWHLEKAAERQHTSVEVQREIYDLQKRKQEIMARLKTQLACLDNPGCVFEEKENERAIEYDESSNGFKYFSENGEEQTATLGDIVADLDWDIYYSISKNVPRAMAKKYLVERAKQELRDLLDTQIIKSELGEIGGSPSELTKKAAYKAVEEDRTKEKVNMQFGFLSEKIVKNFLKKLSIDNKDLPFEIHEGDVFQDVEQKIDFIIHLKERSRGVGVEESAEAKDVGVQFSINLAAKGHKKQQVKRSIEKLKASRERIQDIALVIFPLSIAGLLKMVWQKSGKVAGGPGRFMHRQVAEQIFTKLLKDLLSQEEISKAWEKVQNNFPEKG